jgi:hypothetical protein
MSPDSENVPGFQISRCQASFVRTFHLSSPFCRFLAPQAPNPTMSTTIPPTNRIARLGKNLPCSSFQLDGSGKVPGVVSYDLHKYALYYEWERVSDPTTIISGYIKLTWQGYNRQASAVISVAKGDFPPTSAGRLYFESDDVFSPPQEVESIFRFEYASTGPSLAAVSQTGTRNPYPPLRSRSLTVPPP